MELNNRTRFCFKYALGPSRNNFSTHFLPNDVDLGGNGVTCSPRDPRFASSNLAEVDEIFSGRKNPEHKSSGRDSKPGVPSLRFQAR